MSSIHIQFISTRLLNMDLSRTSSSDGNDSQKQQQQPQHQQQQQHRPQNSVGSQCHPPHLQSQQLPQPASLYGLQQRHHQQQQHHQQRRPLSPPPPVSGASAAAGPGSRQPISVVVQQARQQPISHGTGQPIPVHGPRVNPPKQPAASSATNQGFLPAVS